MTPDVQFVSKCNVMLGKGEQALKGKDGIKSTECGRAFGEQIVAQILLLDNRVCVSYLPMSFSKITIHDSKMNLKLIPSPPFFGRGANF